MEATKSLYERYKYCDKYAVTWFVATARAHKAIEDLLETVSTVSTTDVGLGSGRLSGKARKRAKAAKLVDKEPQLMLKSLQPCSGSIHCGKLKFSKSYGSNLDPKSLG